MATALFGKLTIVAKDGSCNMEYPLDKKSILVGRDSSCDIRIINKEISRKHAELYVEDSGAVFITSMGREPVSLNGMPVMSPTELASGDKIEVHLEGRTRVFYFHNIEKTSQIGSRAAFSELNSASPRPASAGKRENPMPPASAQDAALGGKSAPPPPPPLPTTAAAPVHQECAPVAPALTVKSDPDAAAAIPAAAFVPTAEDLLKLKAGLKKTEVTKPVEVKEECMEATVDATEVINFEEDCVQDEAMDVDGGCNAENTATSGGNGGDGDDAQIVAALVQQAIEAAVQSAEQEEAPMEVAEIQHETENVPSGPGLATAQKARKSVRFNASNTPEGAACDATMTMRFIRGNAGGDQAVLVEDDTMAFADWALGTMGKDGDEDMPDTVVSKKSRRESEAAPIPGSAPRQTPLQASAGKHRAGLFAEAPGSCAASAFPPSSAVKGVTPAGPGARAPASTPYTAARPAAGTVETTMDAASLASKLAELAAEHDVTFELPVDFMRFTPMTLGGKKTISVTITPRTGGARSVVKCAARSAGRSRLGQVGADEQYPAATGEEVQQPHDVGEVVEQLAMALEAAASARKSSHSNKSRRSSARTPGTKIAIISRNVERDGAPSSVKPLRRTPHTEVVANDDVDVDVDDDEMVEAGVEGVPPTVEGMCSYQSIRNSGSEKEVSGESEREGTEPLETEKSAEELSEGGAIDNAAGAKGTHVPKDKKHMHAIMQAKAYRAQSLQLARQARTATARALRLKRVATSLAATLKEERQRRRELQAALQQIVANRAAEHEDEDEEEEDVVVEEEKDDEVAMEIEEEEEQQQQQRKVVVVGYKPAPIVQHTEMAGCVVVVRPASQVVVSGAKTPCKSKTPARSAKKTPVARGSVLRRMSAAAGSGPVLVVDDVEVPAWVLEEGAAAETDVSAELAEVAAAEVEEAREAAQLQQLEKVASEAESESEEEGSIDDEEEEDQCHKCCTGDEGDVLLLCDGCDNACHLSCCEPPLKRVPKGNWYCTECVAKKEETAAPAKKTAARGKKTEAGKKAPAAKAPARGKKAPAAKETAAATGSNKRSRGAASEDAPSGKKARAAPAKRGGRAAAASPSQEPAAKKTTRTRR